MSARGGWSRGRWFYFPVQVLGDPESCPQICAQRALPPSSPEAAGAWEGVNPSLVQGTRKTS